MPEPIELPAWDAPRDCEYCGIEFRPRRAQDAKQHFCNGNCRKNYFRYGAKLRIVQAVTRDFQKQFDALDRRVRALENKSEKSIDRKNESVVTLQPEREQ